MKTQGGAKRSVLCWKTGKLTGGKVEIGSTGTRPVRRSGDTETRLGMVRQNCCCTDFGTFPFGKNIRNVDRRGETKLGCLIKEKTARIRATII